MSCQINGSRKRKMEESNSHGDTFKLQKTQQSGGVPKRCADENEEPKHHDFLAYIKKSEELRPASAASIKSEGEGSQAKKLQLIRLRCSLGDIWHDKHGDPPTSSSPKKVVLTGDSFNDHIACELPYWGYICQSLIDKGRFGSVLLGYIAGTGKRVAIKFLVKNMIHKNQNIKNTNPLPDEVTILQERHHPHIIELYQYLNIRGRICMITEFCENGNLEQLLKIKHMGFITEQVAKRYVKQMLKAVDYLHQNGVSHRDLKCQNWLVDRSNHLKLCDFGCAVRFSSGEELCDDCAGSPGYTAPEVLQENPLYDPRKADIWTLGVDLYQMISGRIPFNYDVTDVLTLAPFGVVFPNQQILQLSKDLVKTVEGMLTVIPDLRYTLNRVQHGEWMDREDDRVFIGNFHLVRQPKKMVEGADERAMKAELLIC